MGIRRKTTVIMNIQHSWGVPSVRSNLLTVPVLTEPTLTPEFGSIERILASPFANVAQLAESFKSGTLSMEMEMQGVANGSPATTPRFHNQLRTAGFRGERTYRCTLTGTPSADIEHGTHFMFNAAADSATEVDGWVIGTALSTATYLYVWKNPFNANAMTTGAATCDFEADGSAAAQTFTVASTTDSYSYWPQTTPLCTVNVGTDGTPLWTGDLAIAADGTNGLLHGDLFDQDSGGATRSIGRIEMPFHYAANDVPLREPRNTPSAPTGSTPTQFTVADPCPIYFQHVDGTSRVAENFPTVGATCSLLNRTGTFALDEVGNSGGTPGTHADAFHFGWANTSATIRANYDGPEFGIHSAVGNPTFRLRNGDRGVIELEYQGAGIQPSDQEPPDYAADGAAPPPIIGGTYLFGTTYNPRFSETSFNLGLEIGLREDPTQDSGYLGAANTGRRPSVTVDPEMVQEAQYDLAEKGWSKGLFRVVYAWGSGTANGNNFEIECPQVQVDALGVGNRVGQGTYDATLVASADVGDGDFILHVW